MDKHYHLLLRTPEPNLSQAIQWLNVRRMAGLKYTAAAQAVRRFGERQASNSDMRRFVANLRRQLERATEGRSFEASMSIVWICPHCLTACPSKV